MPGEWDKMLAGELYDPLDPVLVAARERACRGVRGAKPLGVIKSDGMIRQVVGFKYRS